MELDELKDLDFTKGQIKVFQAVLELGTGGVQSIQEKTGLERRAIYDILNKLIEKGFISYVIEDKKRQYKIVSPKNIKEIIESKKESLINLYNKIPEIEEIYNFKKQSIHAEVYRGNDSMKAMLNEALKYKETYWIGGNSGVEQCSHDMYLFFKSWTKKRIENKNFMYDLVANGTSLEDYPPNNITKHKKEYYKYCELPKDLKSPMVIIIFGDNVAQVLWSKQSFAFVIESKEIKDSFMKYFNYFWKNPY